MGEKDVRCGVRAKNEKIPPILALLVMLSLPLLLLLLSMGVEYCSI